MSMSVDITGWTAIRAAVHSGLYFGLIIRTQNSRLLGRISQRCVLAAPLVKPTHTTIERAKLANSGYSAQD